MTPCPHLQYWETVFPNGKKVRKCVTCRRIEELIDGVWKKCGIEQEEEPEKEDYSFLVKKREESSSSI